MQRGKAEQRQLGAQMNVGVVRKGSNGGNELYNFGLAANYCGYFYSPCHVLGTKKQGLLPLLTWMRILIKTLCVYMYIYLGRNLEI